MNPAPPLSSSNEINLRRLVVLRLIALTGQLAVVWAVVTKLHMELPLRPMIGIIAAMAAVTLVTWLRLRRPRPVPDVELFGQLLLDVVVLTALLYFSGGSTNPFVTLYLLPLAITAAALPGPPTWMMAGITAVCYSALLFYYIPLPESHGVPGESHLHVFGMWLSLIMSTGLISWFAVKMAATLRERDRLLAEMREQELKHERILALGTLAAGAAHELGTPLSTMAVLVKDLKPGAKVAGEKLSILRGQIDRCKKILSSISATASQVRAESGESRPLDAYLEGIVAKWLSMRPGVHAHHRFSGAQPAPRILAEQTLSQAILCILNKAADASPQSVEVDGRWSGEELTLEIADRGSGLAPEIEKNAGKQMLSTKSEGMGLGLFLAYTTFQRFGGSVRLLSRDGGGVLCRLTLPLAPILVSN